MIMFGNDTEFLSCPVTCQNESRMEPRTGQRSGDFSWNSVFFLPAQGGETAGETFNKDELAGNSNIE